MYDLRINHWNACLLFINSSNKYRPRVVAVQFADFESTSEILESHELSFESTATLALLVFRRCGFRPAFVRREKNVIMNAKQKNRDLRELLIHANCNEQSPLI